MARVTTLGEVFGDPPPRLQKGASGDVLGELAAKRAERDARLRQATHLIKAGSVRQDDRDAWVRDNPREAQRLTVREIDERIVKASRDSDRALNADIDQLETIAASWPADLARMKKAEQIAAHLQTPESIAARERLDTLRKRRDELLAENPGGFDLTRRERRERDKLTSEIINAEIEAYEPRFRADRMLA